MYTNTDTTTNYLIANEEVPGNGVVGGHYGWRVFWENAPFEPIANGLYKLYTDYEKITFISICEIVNGQI